MRTIPDLRVCRRRMRGRGPDPGQQRPGNPRVPGVIVLTHTQRGGVDRRTADHREFGRIFTGLEGLSGRTGPDVLKRKRELVDEVTIGLVKHSVAEETRVYPRVATEIDKEQAEHS